MFWLFLFHVCFDLMSFHSGSKQLITRVQRPVWRITGTGFEQKRWKTVEAVILSTKNTEGVCFHGVCGKTTLTHVLFTQRGDVDVWVLHPFHSGAGLPLFAANQPPSC